MFILSVVPVQNRCFKSHFSSGMSYIYIDEETSSWVCKLDYRDVNLGAPNINHSHNFPKRELISLLDKSIEKLMLNSSTRKCLNDRIYLKQRQLFDCSVDWLFGVHVT